MKRTRNKQSSRSPAPSAAAPESSSPTTGAATTTTAAAADIQPGAGVLHSELGEGVLLGFEGGGGYARVFFKGHGERQVSVAAITRAATWNERVIASPQPATPEATRRLWLAVEADRLPLMDSAATLTSAKVDLLPHQIVLTYRIANATPRRFLIADAVGLGKTIETALILRELASRGELTRALMVVPAGLVENWRRELNDTFGLDFEVFGSEGDVTDRRSNAFLKHNRLIVSIDTLKRPARVRRLLEAPRWDLIVFDEAHHLTAYESGNKVRKTQNFRLAEALREHGRDVLLLSATPHQGDHFRFWMLIRLLDGRLFENPDDMVENRHRLNAVVFRRTQADACDANGQPLFARRQVHTSAFHLSDAERKFYESLMDYLRDGYNLAALQGAKGRSLGFVMTIFQKIASSSFAAVASTLRRRLLMLTIHDALVCDENLDTDGRDRAYADARQLIREMYGLPDDLVGRAEVDRILADAKLQLLRKLGEKVIPELDEEYESSAAGDEESAAALVAVALPEERKRIKALLADLPAGIESKTEELLRGLGDLWRSNPLEKVVVFTTYLGSVDALRDAIEDRYPGQGVVVLKGGDHGAKIAAEKRFRRPDGPRVLICTAAGREGINLQFARVLFNHDLPWNPMDMEQRIGRIHRYGQKDTAQVYNLVSADTIEGQIFILLEQKLLAIAETLGKVDEYGQVTEDLRGQILGQLAERISYDQLYQDAVRDPTLRRTKQELEVAVENARLARNVVFELFQDLDTFNLDDYRRFDDGGAGMERLLGFVRESVAMHGGTVRQIGDATFEVALPGRPATRFTTQRKAAKDDDNLSLLGLEHPMVKEFLATSGAMVPSDRALLGHLPRYAGRPIALSVWRVEVHGPNGYYRQAVIPIAVDDSGMRLPTADALLSQLPEVSPALESAIEASRRQELVTAVIPEMLRREVEHRGLLQEGTSLAFQLAAWVELH